MNIAQLSEQLKDVPQNRLVDYAKNPNSVVPQFLALAEIQRRQQLSAQAQPPSSTVANDVLTQAQPAPMVPQGIAAMQPQVQPQMAQMEQQLPENQPGVAQLQSRVAPEGFAGGGIVAFADGGLSLDDDEEDDREMARLFPRASISDIQGILSSIPSGIRSLAEKLPKSYEATKKEVETSVAAPKGSHKYEQAVLEEAKRQGVDPSLALHVLYKETGNLKDPETARSKAGALGVMQLMPKTAAGLGVNPMDPMDNIRGGVTYLKQMADKYKENRLAAAAYNAGPGNLDKALRRQGGLDTLPHETRNYIAGLAQGGEVRKFATGDYVGFGEETPYDPNEPSLADTFGRMIGSPIERLRNSIMGVGPRTSQEIQESLKAKAEPKKEEKKVEPVIPPRQTIVTPPVVEYKKPEDYANAGEKKEEKAPLTDAQLYAQELRDSIKQQTEEAAKQKKLQLGMSLLGAAASGLQSQSPYFAPGMGAALAGGVGTYAGLQKQEAEQAKNILAARLGLYKIGESAEGAKETRELNKTIKQATLGQKESEAEDRASDKAFLRYGTRAKEIEDAIRKPYLANPLYTMNPEKFSAEIQSKIEQAKASDDLLNALRSRAGLGAPIKVATGPVIVQTPKGAVSFPSQEAADEFKRKAGIK